MVRLAVVAGTGLDGERIAFCGCRRNVGACMAFKDTRTWLGLDRLAWAGVLGLLVLLSGGFVWLERNEPRPVHGPVAAAGFSAKQWEVMREVERMEERYRQSGDEPPPAGWEQDLARAITLQEQLLRSMTVPDPGQSLRLERLLVLRDTLRAQTLWPQVLAAEESLARDNDPVEQRMAVMSGLLAMRREINRSHAEVRFKDLVRETQLARDLEDAQAGPLHATAVAAVTQARAAVENRDWVDALAHFARARGILEELNRTHARTKYADLALLKQVRSEEETLQGASLSLEAEVFAAGAEAAAAAGLAEEAAARYARAIELQRQVNGRWPQSRFFTTIKAEAWEARRQTVLAEVLIADIIRRDRQTSGLLSGRQTLEAGRRIVALQAELVTLAQTLPKHRADVGVLRRKYDYLAAMADSLRPLQDDVYDCLLPLPGKPGSLLMRTEVNQALYRQIMKFNPSRETGDDRPVDSVTWSDAAEFCRRLGWVLGQPVRLPRAAEHELASRDILAAENGDGPHGFQRLHDTHAEWLWVTDEADTAPMVAPVTNQAEGQLEPELPRTTKRRDLGFRVLVELPPEGAAIAP